MEISFRFATQHDVDLYYEWANDPVVRNHSYNSGYIDYTKHVEWFNKKINDPNTFMYLFLDEHNNPIGQVRIEKDIKTTIGISIDNNFRNKSLGKRILMITSDDYLTRFPEDKIHAYIKNSNQTSVAVFQKAGYVKEEDVMVKGIPSILMIKYAKH